MLPTQSLMLILLTLSSSYYTKLDELTLHCGIVPVAKVTNQFVSPFCFSPFFSASV
jgi:hypothetical protein